MKSRSTMKFLWKYFPILDWGAKYSRQTFVSDRDNDADSAVTGLCTASRITSGSGAVCLNSTTYSVCNFWNFPYTCSWSCSSGQSYDCGRCGSIGSTGYPGIYRGSHRAGADLRIDADCNGSAKTRVVSLLHPVYILQQVSWAHCSEYTFTGRLCLPWLVPSLAVSEISISILLPLV
jgi:hypothetical protein